MNILKYSVVLGTTLLLPISAFAASLTLNPVTVTPGVGQTFSVNITADPSGAKTYTIRANISFDPASVEFVSFSFAPKWIALSQAGYDSENNAGGVLIKTAGYPGGVTSATVFGTATFRTKSAGASTVSVTNSSLALDAGGKNLISGPQGALLVTVAAEMPKTAPAPNVTPKKEIPAVQTQTKKPTAVQVTTTAPEPVVLAATSAPAVASTALAAVAVGFASSSGLPIAALAIFALVIVGAGVWFFKRRNKGTTPFV